MTINITRREELTRAISSNDVVIVGYNDRNIRGAKDFDRILYELSKKVDPSVLILKVDVSQAPDLGEDVPELPYVRVYLKGKIVFEQHGWFGKPDLDLYVLRRSIRSVLRNLNVTLKI